MSYKILNILNLIAINGKYIIYKCLDEMYNSYTTTKIIPVSTDT